jgi:hypothetical protein
MDARREMREAAVHMDESKRIMDEYRKRLKRPRGPYKQRSQNSD